MTNDALYCWINWSDPVIRPRIQTFFAEMISSRFLIQVNPSTIQISPFKFVLGGTDLVVSTAEFDGLNRPFYFGNLVVTGVKDDEANYMDLLVSLSDSLDYMETQMRFSTEKPLAYSGDNQFTEKVDNILFELAQIVDTGSPNENIYGSFYGLRITSTELVA